MKKIKKKGYTLMEVLVAVVIVTILVAVSVPLYNKVVVRASVSDALNNLSVLAQAQDRYFVNNGSYTKNISDLKIPLKGTNSLNTTNFNYTVGQEEEDFCVYAASNTDNYSLAKNYKSHSKIACSGEDCEQVGFTRTGEEDIEEICRGNGSTGDCGGLNCEAPWRLNAEECVCECDLNSCNPGFTLNNQNGNCSCDCNKTQSDCQPGETFNAQACSCSCEKTEQTCRNINPNYTLQGCQCVCDLTTTCEQGKTFNSQTCTCEDNGGCPVDNQNLFVFDYNGQQMSAGNYPVGSQCSDEVDLNFLCYTLNENCECKADRSLIFRMTYGGLGCIGEIPALDAGCGTPSSCVSCTGSCTGGKVFAVQGTYCTCVEPWGCTNPNQQPVPFFQDLCACRIETDGTTPYVFGPDASGWHTVEGYFPAGTPCSNNSSTPDTGTLTANCTCA